MKTKDTKKYNHIVRYMRECFQCFNLPVEKGRKDDSYDFKSTIENNHVRAQVYIKYKMDDEEVDINFVFGVMTPGHIKQDVIKIINLINGTSPFYYYSLCPCCNEMSMHAPLSIPGKQLAKGKLDWFLRYLLEHTYREFPLIGELAVLGGNPEENYQRFIDRTRDITGWRAGIKPDGEEKVLRDMESVFSDLGITIKDSKKIDTRFNFEFESSKYPGLSFRFQVTLDCEKNTVVISVAPDLIVPNEKMAVMREMVNRLNRLCENYHLFIGESGRNTILTGVRLVNGVLPKEEFKKSYQTVISYADIWFPVLEELITSDKEPTELIREHIPSYQDGTTRHVFP